MAKLNFQAKQVRHDTEFTSGPGISRAGSHWVRGRGRGRTRLWPSPPCQPPLLPHPHIHPHVAICSQTCHVFPCCLPLRKLLPLPKMLLFNLFESSFWKTSVHPTRLSSTPPQSLLLFSWELPFLFGPKYTQMKQVFFCTVMKPSHFSPTLQPQGRKV